MEKEERTAWCSRSGESLHVPYYHNTYRFYTPNSMSVNLCTHVSTLHMNYSITAVKKRQKLCSYQCSATEGISLQQ